MRNVFIFHGVGGSPEENWFPWLRDELTQRGFRVFVPQFPTPEGQTLENWLSVLEKYHEHLTSESILVGQSLGVPFALNIIERYPIYAVFMVAGFVGIADNAFDPGMKTFAQRTFDWATIKQNCTRFYQYHADNDPYLTIDKAERIATNLNIEITLVPGGGHLNQSAGYTMFPQLLQDILRIAG